MFNQTNITFPQNHMSAMQNDINFLNNLTRQKEVFIGNIRDGPRWAVLKSYNLLQRTNSVIVLIIIGLLVGIIYLARKSSKVFHWICSFLFLAQRNTYSSTLQTRRPSERAKEVGEFEMAAIAETAELKTAPLNMGTFAAVGPQPGASSEARQETQRPDSSHYLTMTRTRLVTTPPRKLSRVRVIPPVRFVGEG